MTILMILMFQLILTIFPRLFQLKMELQTTIDCVETMKKETEMLRGQHQLLHAELKAKEDLVDTLTEKLKAEKGQFQLATGRTAIGG